MGRVYDAMKRAGDKNGAGKKKAGGGKNARKKSPPANGTEHPWDGSSLFNA